VLCPGSCSAGVAVLTQSLTLLVAASVAAPLLHRRKQPTHLHPQHGRNVSEQTASFARCRLGCSWQEVRYVGTGSDHEQMHVDACEVGTLDLGTSFGACATQYC
jgi:hypothetical protein